MRTIEVAKQTGLPENAVRRYAKMVNAGTRRGRVIEFTQEEADLIKNLAAKKTRKGDITRSRKRREPKEMLIAEITGFIKNNRLSYSRASEITGIHTTAISRMLNGYHTAPSLKKLEDAAARIREYCGKRSAIEKILEKV
ncbi:MAG: hypothetical protein QXP01_01280 [Candidatus Hadarchaeum sp.]